MLWCAMRVCGGQRTNYWEGVSSLHHGNYGQVVRLDGNPLQLLSTQWFHYSPHTQGFTLAQAYLEPMYSPGWTHSNLSALAFGVMGLLA